MSMFSISWSGDDELRAKFEKLAEAQLRVKACCILSANDILDRGRDGDATPKVSGELRASMSIRETTDGAEVGYSAEYAPHVEYGHRQTPGRYVPAIGRRLVKKYVEGQHYFQQNVNQQGETFKREVEEQLKEL